MKINEICRARKINKANLVTPLLIPSFSSTIAGIFEKGSESFINELYEYLKNDTNYILVSLFDIYHNYIKISNFDELNFVIIDSGYYEYDSYIKSGRKYRWNLKEYNATLKKFNIKKPHAIVNYDFYGDMNKQIIKANKIFLDYDHLVSDFLIKPEKKGEFVNIKKLIDYISSLENYDIIGMSEKELGNSLLERCKNLSIIRTQMVDSGYDKPIHIFGCLNLINVLSLFFCGADIFDGLCWARNTYIDYYSNHVDDYALINHLYDHPEVELYNLSYINNLNKLNEIQTTMIKFFTNYDLNVFNFNKNLFENFNLLLSDAGIDVVN